MSAPTEPSDWLPLSSAGYAEPETERAKHTPGSWAVHPTWPLVVIPADHSERTLGGHADDASDLAGFAQEICSLQLFRRHRSDAEVRANARLIASAPDLYAALKAVVSVADRQTVEFDLARAALSRAEGRNTQGDDR